MQTLIGLIEKIIIHPFINQAKGIASHDYGFFILLAIFIIIVIALNKLKNRKKISLVLNLISMFVFILMLLVGYYDFGPAIKKFLQTTPQKQENTTTPTTTTTKKTPGTNVIPKQTTPTYTAPKKLYYTVSCYSCWNEVCPRDGYSYGGYDYGNYYYYYNMCKACNCNSFKAVSFWK